MIPAWRIAPPICCLIRHASWMKSREPASNGADRRPSPLEKSIQTESNGRVVGGRDAARDHRVHQARAVHVAGEAAPWRRRSPPDRRERPPRRHRGCSCSRPREGASAAHGGSSRPDRCAHLLGREHAALALDRAHHDPGERRRPARFGMERMRARLEDHLVALAAVHPHRDLVAHRPGRQIDRGLLAEQRATRSHRRFTVGSRNICSSPTSASAIARRIPGVGVVCVSLYRSIMPARVPLPRPVPSSPPVPCAATPRCRGTPRRRWGRRLGADQDVDPDAFLERGIRPDALDHEHARLLALAHFRMQAHRAARVAQAHGIAGPDPEPPRVLGMDQHRRPPSLRIEVGVSVKLVFR